MRKFLAPIGSFLLLAGILLLAVFAQGGASSVEGQQPSPDERGGKVKRAEEKHVAIHFTSTYKQTTHPYVLRVQKNWTVYWHLRNYTDQPLENVELRNFKVKNGQDCTTASDPRGNPEETDVPAKETADNGTVWPGLGLLEAKIKGSANSGTYCYEIYIDGEKIADPELEIVDTVAE